MFTKPMQWLRSKWWGLIVAYAMIVVSVYFVLWQIAEPLGVPDTIEQFPGFARNRAVVHIALTLIIAAYVTLVLELSVRRSLTSGAESTIAARRCSKPEVCIVREIRSTEELASLVLIESNEKARDCYHLLAESGCLLEGHFRLVSGKHSSRFIRFQKIRENPLARDFFARQVAELARGIQFDQVIGPSTTAGSGFAEDVAKEVRRACVLFPFDDIYGKRRLMIPEVRAGEMRDKKCLYIDDLITSGDGLVAAVEQLLEKQINVVGVAVAFARDIQTVETVRKALDAKRIDLVFFASIDFSKYTWHEDDCKLCQLIFSQDVN